MSGEKLRELSMHDNGPELEEMIRKRANVCSADQWGLTALHYAVWNGHVECVKLLAFNADGVDSKGQRGSCLKMKSCIGLTALHLAAMECPKPSVKEITTLLILAGADPRIVDDKGKSAYNMATECKNEEFLTALQDYIDVRNGSKDATDMMALYDTLVKRYRFFSSNPQRRQTDAEVLASLPFIAPDFLRKEERVGRLPAELSIHEHNIVPLAKYGYEKMKGIESIKCLTYTENQAEMNRQRREKLAGLQDSQETDAS